ncbi:hypothetical protein [Salipaludibacillus sp. CUR1]|nr:hypothetical protein [Salipaludibacillus sp. CUR1]
MKKFITGLLLIALLTVGGGAAGASDTLSKNPSFGTTSTPPIVMD